MLIAEWTKLRSLPSTLWTLLIVVVTALGGSLILAAASASSPEAPFDPVTGTFIAWGEYPVLGVGVLGVLAVTNEYSNRQIRTTFTAVPRRLRVLAAKATVVGALVLIVMTVLAWCAFGLTEVLRDLHHSAVSLATPGVGRSVTMAGVCMAAIAVFAVGIGALVRHTVGAVITFPAVVFLPLALLTVPWSWGRGRRPIRAPGSRLPTGIAHTPPRPAALVGRRSHPPDMAYRFLGGSSRAPHSAGRLMQPTGCTVPTELSLTTEPKQEIAS